MLTLRRGPPTWLRLVRRVATVPMPPLSGLGGLPAPDELLVPPPPPPAATIRSTARAVPPVVLGQTFRHQHAASCTGKPHAKLAGLALARFSEAATAQLNSAAGLAPLPSDELHALCYLTAAFARSARVEDKAAVDKLHAAVIRELVRRADGMMADAPTAVLWFECVAAVLGAYDPAVTYGAQLRATLGTAGGGAGGGHASAAPLRPEATHMVLNPQFSRIPESVKAMLHAPIGHALRTYAKKLRAHASGCGYLPPAAHAAAAASGGEARVDAVAVSTPTGADASGAGTGSRDGSVATARSGPAASTGAGPQDAAAAAAAAEDARAAAALSHIMPPLLAFTCLAREQHVPQLWYKHGAQALAAIVADSPLLAAWRLPSGVAGVDVAAAAGDAAGVAAADGASPPPPAASASAATAGAGPDASPIAVAAAPDLPSALPPLYRFSASARLLAVQGVLERLGHLRNFSKSLLPAVAALDAAYLRAMHEGGLQPFNALERTRLLTAAVRVHDVLRLRSPAFMHAVRAELAQQARVTVKLLQSLEAGRQSSMRTNAMSFFELLRYADLFGKHTGAPPDELSGHILDASVALASLEEVEAAAQREERERAEFERAKERELLEKKGGKAGTSAVTADAAAEVATTHQTPLGVGLLTALAVLGSVPLAGLPAGRRRVEEWAEPLKCVASAADSLSWGQKEAVIGIAKRAFATPKPVDRLVAVLNSPAMRGGISILHALSHTSLVMPEAHRLLPLTVNTRAMINGAIAPLVEEAGGATALYGQLAEAAAAAPAPPAPATGAPLTAGSALHTLRYLHPFLLSAFSQRLWPPLPAAPSSPMAPAAAPAVPALATGVADLVLAAAAAAAPSPLSGSGSAGGDADEWTAAGNVDVALRPRVLQALHEHCKTHLLPLPLLDVRLPPLFVSADAAWPSHRIALFFDGVSSFVTPPLAVQAQAMAALSGAAWDRRQAFANVPVSTALPRKLGIASQQPVPAFAPSEGALARLGWRIVRVGVHDIGGVVPALHPPTSRLATGAHVDAAAQRAVEWLGAKGLWKVLQQTPPAASAAAPDAARPA